MIRKRWFTLTVCAAALGLGIAAVLATPQAHAQGKGENAADSPDIIGVATGPGMEQVSIVVKAIQAAGLVDTLKGAGPFTVFAPTNDAFAKLPPGTLDDLLKPENKEKLKAILLYHVHVGDSIKSVDAKTMALSSALKGKDLHVAVTDTGVTVNGAKIVKADVHASNGTIHWIDTVLMPPE